MAFTVSPYFTMLFPKKQINGEKESQQQIAKDGLNGSEEEAGLVEPLPFCV